MNLDIFLCIQSLTNHNSRVSTDWSILKKIPVASKLRIILLRYFVSQFNRQISQKKTVMSRDYDKAGSLVSKHEGTIIEERNPSTGAVVRKYTKGKLLGKGGFAKCYELMSHENNKKLAVKVIEKASLTRSKAREKLNSEIKIHRSLKSIHVVGFNHFFEDDDHVYIILELCSNQTLNELVKRRKRITEIEAKYYLHQIALGIKDLQNSKIIHRDLKLGNLFLNDKLEIKIGDFGLAAKLSFDTERRKTMCGTPNYIAPEILDNSGGHSYEVDIWSLGVIAYAMVVGRPPFETNDVRATYSKIKSCNYSFPETIPLSKTVRKFISKALMRDPSRRSTIDEIISDEFFTLSPFPKTLPNALLACPPNTAFIKQYSEHDGLKNSSDLNHQSSRGISERKDLKQREPMNTDRLSQKDKERESLGRVLVRASSIDRIEKKSEMGPRACSTAALMLPRRQISSSEIHRSGNKNHGQGPHIWVTYSEENPKFGLCYMLNSHATGMKFNDSTYIISNNNFTRIKYYATTRERPTSSGEVYEIARTPSTLDKKMKIISYYHNELKNRKEQEENTISNEERISRERLRYRESAETAMNVFVVKHYKTTKVSIFWFNNRDYQALFKDSTELLVTNQNFITYVNKLAERKYFQLSELGEQSEEVKKRMNHVLTLMQKIRQSTVRASENANKENEPNLVRSSSMAKVQKVNKPSIMKGSASMSRLAPYKFTK